MKTIKLIALCTCLLLGTYSAYAQTNAQLEQEAADMQKRIQQLEQDNANLEKQINQAAQEAKAEADALKPEIQKITNGMYYGKTHEFEDYMDLFLKREHKQRMQEIYALREDIVKLNKSIKKHEAWKDTIVNKLNDRIGSLTNSDPKITKKIFTNKSSQEFVKMFDNAMRTRHHIAYPKETLQEVQKEYNDAKDAYKRTEERLEAKKEEKKQKVGKMNAFLEGCPECKEEYYKRFPNG